MFGKASILPAIILIVTLFYFYDLFGETPVNLLGWGGRDAFANLLINMVSHALIAIVLSIPPIIFVQEKKSWFIQVITGSSISTIFLMIYIVVSLTLGARS